MKVRNKGTHSEDKVELMMTPMIDIVFQLLVFFLLTFKIVQQEGDFNIKMPIGQPREGQPDDTLPPMKLRLRADSEGALRQISLSERNFNDFRGLHTYIIGILGDDRGPRSLQATAEVEIDADYNLHYEHVIEAITAISGFVTPDGKVVKLIEKIKFSPPRAPPPA